MTTTAPTPSPAYVSRSPRIADLPGIAPENYRAMRRLADSVELDTTLHELIKVRVAQINGCAFCLDMHSHDARRYGETAQRLDTLAGWRESPFFTAAERAALGLAEAMTKLDGSPIPDDVYDEAAAHFDEATLAQVIFAVVVINSWTRIVLTVLMQPPTR